MERPQFVLIVLIAIGLGVSGFFYGANQKSILAKEHQKELAAQERDLRSEIEKLKPPVGPAELMPEGSSTATDATGHLEEQVAFLEDQLDLLRVENARLIKLVDRLETKLKSAGTTGEARSFSGEEENALSKVQQLTAKSRELEFKTPVKIEFTDWEGMSAAIADTIRPKRTPEEQAKMNRAYAAMGFVPPTVDVTKEITNLLSAQLGAALYVGDNKILFNQDGNLKSVHDRTSLAVALDHALHEQNFDLGKVPPPVENNDDIFTATNALLVGDSSIIKLRHMMYDVAAPTDDLKTSPTALSREDFAAATPYVREYFLFPYTMGMSFCKALHEEGKWKAINAAIQNPPNSTAEILHPELYMSEENRFRPEPYAWPGERLKLDGIEPLWNNVAGELAISVYLNRAYYKYSMAEQAFYDTDLPPLSESDFKNSPGSNAAKGWLGDRYLVYPNGDGAGGSDHIFWRSKWSSAQDAAEFFHGVRVALAVTHSLRLDAKDWRIEPDPANREPITPDTTGTSYEKVSGRKRHLSIELDPETREVTVINAGDETWLETLRKLR